MLRVIDYPYLVFFIGFVTLWLAAKVGTNVLRKRRTLDQGMHEDYDLILAATLTLLGLIIGFSFSMAVNRYDLRKNYEEAEANAIGTEYLRAGLMPNSNAAQTRTLLRSYLEQRMQFYDSRDEHELALINARTAQLQSEMWSVVQATAIAQPNPVMALVASGMNDVINSQGYTQAAWWNRIPVAAWALMLSIAVCANLLVGYGVRDGNTQGGLRFVLPLVVSLSFFLIADIDSPRGGLIRVVPQNLIALAASLPAP